MGDYESALLGQRIVEAGVLVETIHADGRVYPAPRVVEPEEDWSDD